MSPPFKTSHAGKETSYGWLVRHVSYRGDDCLKWPFGGANGYGTFGSSHRVRYAHRVMCELAHGPAPSSKHESSHSCGRGHQGCVNPRHLSWKTKSENQWDRVRHGRGSPGPKGKLTPKQAAEIRALKGRVTQKELAHRYGVSRSNISFIHTGKAWAGPNKFFPSNAGSD